MDNTNEKLINYAYCPVCGTQHAYPDGKLYPESRFFPKAKAMEAKIEAAQQLCELLRLGGNVRNPRYLRLMEIIEKAD